MYIWAEKIKILPQALGHAINSLSDMQQWANYQMQHWLGKSWSHYIHIKLLKSGQVRLQFMGLSIQGKLQSYHQHHTVWSRSNSSLNLSFMMLCCVNFIRNCALFIIMFYTHHFSCNWMQIVFYVLLLAAKKLDPWTKIFFILKSDMKVFVNIFK